MMGFFPQVLGDFTPDTWWRLLIIIAVYLLYLAVFFSVGLFVSAFSQRSSTSFIVLLVVWVLFVTIVPRVSLASAERLRPYESYTTLQTKAFKEIAEKRAAVIKEVIPRITAIQQKLAMAEISGQALEPSTEFSEIRTEIWERLNKIRQDTMERYDAQYEREQSAQISLAESMSRFLSPASAMSFAVENLAGSGWARQKEYIKQLRDFRNRFSDYIFNAAKKVEYRGFMDMFDARKLDVDASRIRFDFREEDLATVVSRSILDIGVLALMSIIFFAASFVAFLRYDVR